MRVHPQHRAVARHDRIRHHVVVELVARTVQPVNATSTAHVTSTIAALPIDPPSSMRSYLWNYWFELDQSFTTSCLLLWLASLLAVLRYAMNFRFCASFFFISVFLAPFLSFPVSVFSLPLLASPLLLFECLFLSLCFFIQPRIFLCILAFINSKNWARRGYRLGNS